MMYFFNALAFLSLISCSNTTAPATRDLTANKTSATQTEVASAMHFKGALIGGLKGDSIFFDVSANGKKLENLTFKGYWRCSGKLEQLRAVGPEGAFDIVNGVAKGHISDPPDGGSTAWRFDIDATIKGATATGTFRMNINNLGCDTYLLKFTAVQK
ncbi:MAG: hypothetical protein ABI784_09605 [Ginsengibacter sp.]